MTRRRRVLRATTAPSRTAPATPGGTPLVLTIRGPEDLVVATPYLLGFRPRRSLVLVATGGPRHRVELTIRVDLPGEPAPAGELDAYLAGLTGALRRVGAGWVNLLIYPDLLDDPALHAQVLPRLDLVDAVRGWLADAGVRLLEALCVVPAGTGQDRYWSYLCADSGCCPVQGRVADEDSGMAVRFAFTTAGRVVQTGREQIVAAVAAEPVADPAVALLGTAAEAAFQSLLVARVGSDRADRSEAPDRAGPALCRWRRDTARQLDAELVLVASQVPLGDLQVSTQGLLLAGLCEVHVRDLLVAEAVRRDRVEELAEVLLPLVRRAPAHLVAAAAATLALVAYLGGDGALAWVAVDRARGEDPDQSLAGLVACSLEHGLPPAGMRRAVSSLPALAGWDGAPVPAPTSGPGRRTDTGRTPARRRQAPRRAG